MCAAAFFAGRGLEAEPEHSLFWSPVLSNVPTVKNRNTLVCKTIPTESKSQEKNPTTDHESSATPCDMKKLNLTFLSCSLKMLKTGEVKNRPIPIPLTNLLDIELLHCCANVKDFRGCREIVKHIN